MVTLPSLSASMRPTTEWMSVSGGSATGLQMVTPGWVASVGGGETLQKCAGWLVGMRKDHPLAHAVMRALAAVAQVTEGSAGALRRYGVVRLGLVTVLLGGG